jgi:hypothetical protein
MGSSIFFLASHSREVETSSIAFPAGESTHPTRMISSHNRVPSILVGFLLSASSPAFAAGNEQAKTASDNSAPAAARISSNTPVRAVVANTAARPTVSAEPAARPVVITTESLFIKARPHSVSASVVITTEPLIVQSLAQK